MPLQPNGLISIADICGANGLNIGFNPPARSLSELANLANTTSLPYANRATPSLFDWYSYNPVTTPTTVTLNLGAVAQNSVNLTWSTHIGQDGFVVAGYRVFQNGALRADNIPSNVNNFGDSSLVVNTDYSYYVQAFNAGGTTKNSNTVSFHTPDTTPPNVFDIYGGVQSIDKNSFSWQLAGDNVGVVGYRIFREGVLLATVGGTVSSYVDSGLPPATIYHYKVQAYDQAGNIRDSITIQLSTLPDTIPPNAFTLTAGVSTINSNSMSWNLAGDNIGVAHYLVMWDGLGLAMLAGNVNSYIDTNLQPNTLYTYFVKAIDQAGNETSSNTIQMVTQSVGAGIPFAISNGSTESGSACGKGASNTIYANSNTIVAGMIMYSDSYLTTPFNGGSKWYKNVTNNTRMFIQSSGSVNQPVSCS